MKKVGLVVALGAAIGAATMLTAGTQAMPVSQLGANKVDLSMLEKTQLFIFGGRHYCFYLNGWHGPGWYWCGYALRRGYGWGGPEGWHGWHHGYHPHPGPHGGPHPGPHGHHH